MSDVTKVNRGISPKQLTQFFEEVELSDTFYLDPKVEIIDFKLFIKTLLTQVKTHGVNTPAFDTLLNFKNQIEDRFNINYQSVSAQLLEEPLVEFMSKSTEAK